MGNNANILLVWEGFDRIEAGGGGGGVEASSEGDDNGKGDCAEDQPPGNGGNVHGGKILAMKVEVCAESEGAADEPAKEGAENPADQTHYAGFHEEKLLDVAVCGAESLQDADFAAAFKDGHNQRVDDAERGDGESEADKDAEKQIEHGEKDAQALGGVQKRERAEAHVLDGGFEGFDIRRAFGAHGEAGESGFRGRATDDVAEIVDLGGAKSHGDLQRNEEAAVAIAAKARRGLGVHDTHDAQTQFPRNDGETAGRRFGIGSGAGVRRIRRERLALGVAEGKLFAEERGRLRIELFGELALQDGCVGAGAGKKGTLHAVKGTARFGGFGHAGDHGGEWLAVVANFREKTNLGKDFDDVGEAGDFLTRAFVEETRLLVQRGRHGGTAHAAKIHSRGHENRVEQSALREAFGGQLLEADAEGKHGHE